MNQNISIKSTKTGDSGESNPGPRAPKARIIPLDHYPYWLYESPTLLILYSKLENFSETRLWSTIAVDTPTANLQSQRTPGKRRKELLTLTGFCPLVNVGMSTRQCWSAGLAVCSVIHAHVERKTDRCESLALTKHECPGSENLVPRPTCLPPSPLMLHF